MTTGEPGGGRRSGNEVEDWRIEQVAAKAADGAIARVMFLLGVNTSDGASVGQFRDNQAWVSVRRATEATDRATVRKSLIERLVTGAGLLLLMGLTGYAGVWMTKGFH